jgi:site-specific recombinase
MLVNCGFVSYLAERKVTVRRSSIALHYIARRHGYIVYMLSSALGGDGLGRLTVSVQTRLSLSEHLVRRGSKGLYVGRGITRIPIFNLTKLHQQLLFSCSNVTRLHPAVTKK